MQVLYFSYTVVIYIFMDANVSRKSLIHNSVTLNCSHTVTRHLGARKLDFTDCRMMVDMQCRFEGEQFPTVRQMLHILDAVWPECVHERCEKEERQQI